MIIADRAWLWASFAAASWLPERAAVAGILVAALADPAASLVGSRFGRGARKSWSGTLAALVVAMAALFTLEIGWHGATLGAVVAAALERWPGIDAHATYSVIAIVSNTGDVAHDSPDEGAPQPTVGPGRDRSVTDGPEP